MSQRRVAMAAVSKRPFWSPPDFAQEKKSAVEKSFSLSHTWCSSPVQAGREKCSLRASFLEVAVDPVSPLRLPDR